MKKITAILSAIAILFGCSPSKPQIDDGPGMEYHDSDYRTEYANVLDFESWDGVYFAVAFLGYGDKMDFRNTYVKDIFTSLPQEAIDNIKHFDFEGDEWYLIVPRYKEYVEVTNTETNEKHTVYQGEAFTVKCNLSDLHPNVVISTDFRGEHNFSPAMDGSGKLIANDDVYDITDYTINEK